MTYTAGDRVTLSKDGLRNRPVTLRGRSGTVGEPKGVLYVRVLWDGRKQHDRIPPEWLILVEAAPPPAPPRSSWVRELAEEFVTEGCKYGDGCPSSARHGRCIPCKFKAAIEYDRHGLSAGVAVQEKE